MYHVLRNSQGVIETVSRHALAGSEALPASHPDLAHFLDLAAAPAVFDNADAEFVRVLEDLIDTLIMNNVIRHTDLPAPAQQKIARRKGLRRRLQGSLDLLEGDHGVL